MTIQRRQVMVWLILAAQLVVLLSGFAVLQSWLAGSIRQAVAARSFESQLGAAQMLTREIHRMQVRGLTPATDDWRRVMAAVQSWRPESGWFVSIVTPQTGRILAHPDPSRVGQTLPGSDALLEASVMAVASGDVPVPGTIADHWVVGASLIDLDAALFVHAPVAPAELRIQRFLNTLRVAGLLTVFAMAGCGSLVTWKLMSRYESRFKQINAWLEEKVAKRTQQLERNRDAVIYAVAKVAETRDEGTGRHLERIACYTGILADELVRRRPALGPDWSKVVSTTSILHDIGKVGVPDAVLLKPGKLTEEERLTIQKHTVIGSDTLQAIRTQWGGDTFLDLACEIVLGHHERWNGSGYPRGTVGEDIPLSARVVAVADVYDALTSVRPYKTAMTHDEAAQRLREGAGTHFDPAMIQVFEAVSQQMDEARGRLQDGDLQA